MANSVLLRPYQIESIDEIKRHYASGIKKVLLWLPTGAGKTTVFTEILRAVLLKGSRALVVGHGREIVNNIADRLYRSNVPHGVIMNGHTNIQRDALIQVCSIDTLLRRDKAYWPKADIVIIDEAHMATSKSFRVLCDHYPDTFYLAVTATPNTLKGLRHIADVYVSPVTMLELIEMGYLARPEYYIALNPDLSGIKLSKDKSDYDLDDLMDHIRDNEILGDCVKTYTSKTPDSRALCFAVDVAHSRMLCDRFNSAEIKAVHVEAATPRGTRLKYFDQLAQKDINVICSVGTLTTGVDIPEVETIIMMRPTKQSNLWQQMVGRGTRVTETKKKFTILDHAGNTEAHMPVEYITGCYLNGVQYKKPAKNIRCVGCGTEFSPFLNWALKNPQEAGWGFYGVDYNCPECGAYNFFREIENAEERKAGPIVENKEFDLIQVEAADIAVRQIGRFIRSVAVDTVLRGHKEGRVYVVTEKEFGAAVAQKYSNYMKAIICEIKEGVARGKY